MISSLPVKALRTLVDIVRLAASGSTCILKAEPGNLDIKRRETGILFISLPIFSFYKLAIMTSFSILLLIQRHYRVPTVREKSVKNEKSSRSGKSQGILS